MATRCRQNYIVRYHIIAGNFQGVQYCQCLIFADACDHAYYTLYNHTYFAGLIFAESAYP
jgi:hypothetical protein